MPMILKVTNPFLINTSLSSTLRGLKPLTRRAAPIARLAKLNRPTRVQIQRHGEQLILRPTLATVDAVEPTRIKSPAPAGAATDTGAAMDAGLDWLDNFAASYRQN